MKIIIVSTLLLSALIGANAAAATHACINLYRDQTCTHPATMSSTYKFAAASGNICIPDPDTSTLSYKFEKGTAAESLKITPDPDSNDCNSGSAISDIANGIPQAAANACKALGSTAWYYKIEGKSADSCTAPTAPTNTYCYITKAACDVNSTSSKLVVKDACYKEGSSWFKYTYSGTTLTKDTCNADCASCTATGDVAATNACPSSSPYIYNTATASGQDLKLASCTAATGTRKLCFAVHSANDCSDTKEATEYELSYADATPSACIKYSTTNYAKVTINSSTADNGDITHSMTSTTCASGGTAVANQVDLLKDGGFTCKQIGTSGKYIKASKLTGSACAGATTPTTNTSSGSILTISVLILSFFMIIF